MTALDISQYGSAGEGENGWNLPIRHWSPSSFDTFRKCPYLWQQKYINKRRERPNEAMSLGSAVHAALERNFKQKIDSGQDLAVGDLVDWFTDQGFHDTVVTEELQAEEETFWETSFDAARTRGRLALAAYLNLVAPRIQPIDVELVFEIDFGLPVPIQGRIDLLTKPVIIDFKTAKKKTTKPYESWRIAAAVYTEAADRPMEFHSLAVTLAKNDVTITTPLESEDLLLAPTETERAEMKRTLATISDDACNYMARYGPSEPWPTFGRFHPFACDRCSMRAGCPAWKES